MCGRARVGFGLYGMGWARMGYNWRELAWTGLHYTALKVCTALDYRLDWEQIPSRGGVGLWMRMDSDWMGSHGVSSRRAGLGQNRGEKRCRGGEWLACPCRRQARPTGHL